MNENRVIARLLLIWQCNLAFVRAAMPRIGLQGKPARFVRNPWGPETRFALPESKRKSMTSIVDAFQHN